jgi:hypothetical protein
VAWPFLAKSGRKQLAKKRSNAESETEKKVSSITALVVKVSEMNGINHILDINRYSTLRKLVRVTAFIMRFVNKLKDRRMSQHDSELTEEISTLSRKDLISPENAWVKAAQSDLRQQDNFE